MKALEAAQTVKRAGLTGSDALLVMAIGALESSWGGGWKNAGVGSNNWGAITAGSSWTGATFEHGDSLYNEKTGKVESYQIEFRAYPTPEDGARDLWNVLSSKRHEGAVKAAREGNWLGVSESLRNSGYFLGVKAKPYAVRDHYNRMVDIINGWPDSVFAELGVTRPVLKKASVGVGGLLIVGVILAVFGYSWSRK